MTGNEPQPFEDSVSRARALTDSIKPLLAGHGADVQGATLCELVALHVAGHPPEMRNRVLALHVECVRQLIPVVDCELFGAAGHPGKQ